MLHHKLIALMPSAPQARWLLLACFSVFFIGCSKQEAVVRAATPPARIISTSPATTELLFALGLGDKVVGVTRFCDYPLEAKVLPKIGGFSDLSLESIVALRPDMVVGARNGSNRAAVEKLESLGIETRFPPDTSLEESFRAMQEIGTAVGAAEKAASLVGNIQRRLVTLRTEAAAKGKKPKVLLVLGWKPLIVAGPSSFLGALLVDAGAENIVAEGSVAYPSYALESVLQHAPEVIVDASMTEAESQADVIERWKSFSTLPAVQQQRIYPAPSAALLRPGPRIAEGLEALILLIHQE
jgi:iron complex transport system substrate-binding protein